MYSFIALVSGFVQGTGASCSSSSISTFDSVVGDAGVGVSLAGEAREETVGPGEAEDARPDGLCLPSDGCGSAGTSSGCCWNRRWGKVVPKKAPSTPLKRELGGVYVSTHVGQKSFTPSTPGKSDRPEGKTFV